MGGHIADDWSFWEGCIIVILKPCGRIASQGGWIYVVVAVGDGSTEIIRC